MKMPTDGQPCPVCKTGECEGHRVVCRKCEKVLAQDDDQRRLQEALELARRHEAVLEQERMSFVW